MKRVRRLAWAWSSFVVCFFGASNAYAIGAVVGPPEGGVRMTAARVAVSVGPSRTTRWASVSVDASGGRFVWLVSVRPGALVDVAADAWLDALDAATAPRVIPPRTSAPACDVGVGVEEDDAFRQVRSIEPAGALVAPDAATLAGALDAWGVVEDAGLAAAAQATFAQGLSILAVDFTGTPGSVVTRTLRIVDDGPATLPLSFTHDLHGPVRVTAYSVGPWRSSFGNLPELALDPRALTWSTDARSSYGALENGALTLSMDAWLVQTAGHAPLFTGLAVPTTGGYVASAADTYFQLVSTYGGELDALTCADQARSYSASDTAFPPPCALGQLAIAGEGIACTPPASLPFGCGTANELAFALGDLVPSGVWVTRAASLVSPEGVSGDVALGPSSGPETGPVLVADSFDFACTAVGTSVGVGTGPSGSGTTTDPSGNSAPGDVPTGADQAGDACGGDTSSGDGSSSDSSSGCDSSSSGDSGGDASGCGSGSGGDAGGGCDGASGGAGADCTVFRSGHRHGKSPLSRTVLLMVAFAAVARRLRRRA